MRALICGDFGPPEALSVGELPAPQPGKGEVLINVGAAGVSFADTLMIRDLHQNKHTLPFAAGMEVGGRITALGEGVDGFAVGDRVMALVYDGGYAEQAVAPALETFRIPESMDDATAAAWVPFAEVHDGIRPMSRDVDTVLTLARRGAGRHGP